MEKGGQFIMQIFNYPKIHNLGHSHIANLFQGEVLIEEKVDGSQFSFGMINGTLMARSKNQALNVENNDNGMFTKAIETIKELAPFLPEGYTFRGEFLQKPKHNTLCYDRVPNKNIILYDVETGSKAFVNRPAKEAWAKELDLDIVPVLFEGLIENQDQLEELLSTTSTLGTVKVEGVVIKNYTQHDEDGHPLFGKLVSTLFRELNHKTNGRLAPKSDGSALQLLAERYRTMPRWEKAIQRLRDSNELENSPVDIGKLMRIVQTDIEEECETEIKEDLYKWARKAILKHTVNGLPDWYKEKLVEKQFTQGE